MTKAKQQPKKEQKPKRRARATTKATEDRRLSPKRGAYILRDEVTQLRSPRIVTEARMFIRMQRNFRVKSALELTTGVAATVFVGMAVLNPIDAYFNTSIFGNLGWLEYAFFGVCGMMGWYFWGNTRKS